MILTPQSLLKLEGVLGGAITTSQPEFHVDYIDYGTDGVPSPPQPARGALNSTTDVTFLSTPTTAKSREVVGLFVYNKDTVNATVTVKTDDGTTERILVKQVLAAAETLCWDKNSGWYVLGA